MCINYSTGGGGWEQLNVAESQSFYYCTLVYVLCEVLHFVLFFCKIKAILHFFFWQTTFAIMCYSTEWITQAVILVKSSVSGRHSHKISPSDVPENDFAVLSLRWFTVKMGCYMFPFNTLFKSCTSNHNAGSSLKENRLCNMLPYKSEAGMPPKKVITFCYILLNWYQCSIGFLSGPKLHSLLRPKWYLWTHSDDLLIVCLLLCGLYALLRPRPQNLHWGQVQHAARLDVI